MEKREKDHNQLVIRFSENPSLLNIDGLDKSSMIGYYLFPKLKGGNKETGDLIIVWGSQKKIEILILEVSTSINWLKAKEDRRRIRASFRHFFECPRDFIKNLSREIKGLEDITKGRRVRVRGISVFCPMSSFPTLSGVGSDPYTTEIVKPKSVLL